MSDAKKKKHRKKDIRLLLILQMQREKMFPGQECLTDVKSSR